MIQRELQVVRLQYDFPGEWTFEGDFESNKQESPLPEWAYMIVYDLSGHTQCQFEWYRG